MLAVVAGVAAAGPALGALGKAGFPVADVGPWRSGVVRRDVVNSVVDSHPNPRGHAILAEGMEAFLAERGLLAGGP